MMPASGGTGGDLRWRSSLRLSPAPPIYGVMGDHSLRRNLQSPLNIHVEQGALGSARPLFVMH